MMMEKENSYMLTNMVQAGANPCYAACFAYHPFSYARS